MNYVSSKLYCYSFWLLYPAFLVILLVTEYRRGVGGGKLQKKGKIYQFEITENSPFFY